jgi:phenylpropionate dioxygenase-like ring-hydroxylating dioxygenase large terminal subunit
MRRSQNLLTQPFRQYRIFNNWDVVVKGWYVVCESDKLERGQASSFEICGQRLVVFRTEGGEVRALDAFCPHMGTDLGSGKVVGQTIRCVFHHWRFDGQSGKCVDIPCQEKIPERAKLKAYATSEKYGFIWVYPEEVAPYPVMEFPDLRGHDVMWLHDETREGQSHHHVGMINGIDRQHARTVHGLDMTMDVDYEEDRSSNAVHYVLGGPMPEKTFLQRMQHWFFGGRVCYSISFADASIGCMTTLRDMKLFGRWPQFPALHTMFSHATAGPGKTITHTFFLTKKRRGIFGWLYSWLLLRMTRTAHHVLRGQDAVVYRNMRFSPTVLIQMDEPVARFIKHTNRLEPSQWSRALPEDDQGSESTASTKG